MRGSGKRLSVSILMMGTALLGATLSGCISDDGEGVDSSDYIHQSDDASLSDRSVELEKNGDSSINLLLHGTHDVYTDITDISIGDRSLYEDLIRKIESGEWRYDQTNNGVIISGVSLTDIIADSNQSDMDAYDDISLNVNYDSGISLYLDLSADDNVRAKIDDPRRAAVVWVVTRVWDGTKWTVRWVKKYASRPVKSVTFGHGARHITRSKCGFSGSRYIYYLIERKIKSDMKERASNNTLVSATRGSYPSIYYRGARIEYRPYDRGNGKWNVGTYYCK